MFLAVCNNTSKRSYRAGFSVFCLVTVLGLFGYIYIFLTGRVVWIFVMKPKAFSEGIFCIQFMSYKHTLSSLGKKELPNNTVVEIP